MFKLITMMISEKEVRENRKLFSETDKNMIAMFKVLSDLNRYRIFRLLAERPKLTIGSISIILDISLPLTSQHIKILTNANMLQKERVGKSVFSKLKSDDPFVRTIVKSIQAAIKLGEKK